MAPNDTDRRRFLLATALTLLALPALWWANQQADSGAPNVATVGVNVGVDVGVNAGIDVESSTGATAATSATPLPAGQAGPAVQPTVGPPAASADDESEPVFLGGPNVDAGGGLAEIAVPVAPAVLNITTKATYLNSITPKNSCLVAGVRTGAVITVVNLDNGRAVSCVATQTYTTSSDGLILHPDAFSTIADLTDAPIPVEIRQ